MSVSPSAQWKKRHDAKVMQAICDANMAKFAKQDQEKAKIEAIAKANLAKWEKEKADREAFQKLCAENKAKAARAAEALKLARARLSAAEWEEWSSRIGDIARNGRKDYSSDDLMHDLRTWGYLEAGRFISKFDPDYVQPAVKLG